MLVAVNSSWKQNTRHPYCSAAEENNMLKKAPMGSLDELLEVFAVNVKRIVAALLFNRICCFWSFSTAGVSTLKKHDNWTLERESGKTKNMKKKQQKIRVKHRVGNVIYWKDERRLYVPPLEWCFYLNLIETWLWHSSILYTLLKGNSRCSGFHFLSLVWESPLLCLCNKKENQKQQVWGTR